MGRRPSLLAAVCVLSCLPIMLVGAAAGQTTEPDSPLGDLRVVDRGTIEVDGMRLLTMSPDGRWLAAYQFNEDDSAVRERLCAVAVADPADRRCADLVGVEAGLWAESVVWSPDSTRLAFAEQTFVRLVDGDLWVFEVESGTLTNVADDGFSGRLSIFDEDDDAAFFLDVAPAWSPDGRQIAFSRSEWRDGAFRGNSIERIDAVAGATPEQVIRVTDEEPGVVYFPMLWTPDGERLIYHVTHSTQSDPQNGLWMVSLTERQPRRLLNHSDVLGAPIPLEVSADGARVLVVYSALNIELILDETPYVLVDLATKQVEPVAPPAGGQRPHPIAFQATFSPDGSMVLYVTRLTDPDNQVIVRDLATGEEATLVDELERVAMLRFGRNLAWAENGTVFIPTGLPVGTVLDLAGERANAPPPTSPPAPTPLPPATPAPTATGSTLTVGATAVVNDANVSLRAAPSTDAPLVAELSQGTEVEIIGPAETGGGFVWWPVRDPTTRTIGYVRAEFLSPPAES